MFSSLTRENCCVSGVKDHRRSAACCGLSQNSSNLDLISRQTAEVAALSLQQLEQSDFPPWILGSWACDKFMMIQKGAESQQQLSIFANLYGFKF